MGGLGAFGILLGFALVLGASASNVTARVKITMRLTDVEYTADLETKTKQAYKDLESDLQTKLKTGLASEMSISESEIDIIINSFSSGSVIVNATVELSSDTNATAAEKAVEDGLKAVTENSTAFGYQVEADSISTQGVTVDPTETTTQTADTNTQANGADGGTTTQPTETDSDGGTTTQASANAGKGHRTQPVLALSKHILDKQIFYTSSDISARSTL
ncbi:uncharacterized protein LOC134762690 [Penaeus indicus]|uniref:uncharacterized protein LOC134762690 n=1 Tax=Penaeus indicus TaxID=29960 RepID=UPI00300C5DF5